MKKTLALLLAVLMVVSLFAGCAAKQEPAQTEEPAADTPSRPENPLLPKNRLQKRSQKNRLKSRKSFPAK